MDSTTTPPARRADADAVPGKAADRLPGWLVRQGRAAGCVLAGACSAAGTAPEQAPPGLVVIESAGNYLCAGALIAATEVLTAEHCIRGEALANLRVHALAGATPTTSIRAIRVPHASPESRDRPYDPGTDLAVLTLHEALPGSRLTPAPAQARGSLTMWRLRAGAASGIAGRARYEAQSVALEPAFRDGRLWWALPAAAPGDSGAPVVDRHGRIAAIVTGVTGGDGALRFTLLLHLCDPGNRSGSGATPTSRCIGPLRKPVPRK